MSKTAVLIVSLSWQEMGGFRGTVEPPIEEVSGAHWDQIMAHLAYLGPDTGTQLWGPKMAQLHPGWLIWVPVTDSRRDLV